MQKKDNVISVYMCNINGLTPKVPSIQEIMSRIKPQIVVLCETKASNSFIRKVCKENGYETCVKKGMSANSGGLVIGVRDNWTSPIDVTCSDDPNICAAKLKFRNGDLRIIAAYGPQESDSLERRGEFYQELDIEIESAFNQGDLPIIVGDLNAKIDIDNEKNNLVSLSPNGKCLLDVIHKHNLFPANFHHCCDGKWTRQNRKNTNEKSVIDYVLVPNSVYDNIFEVTVDEELLSTPFNMRKTKSGTLRQQFTDHNAIIVKWKSVFLSTKKSTPDNRRWILTEEGLNNFTKLTEDDKSSHFANSGSTISDYNEFEKVLNAKMNLCFRRSKTNKIDSLVSGKWYSKLCKILKRKAKEGKVQRKVVNSYLELLRKITADKVQAITKRRIKNTVINMTEKDMFSAAGFWKIKKGMNATQATKSSVINNKGVEVSSDIAIVHEYEKEFQNRLRKREISPCLLSYQEATNTLLRYIIAEGINHPTSRDFTLKEVEDKLKVFKRNKAPGLDLFPPEIFLHGGKWMVENILRMANSMKHTLQIPDQFNDLMITTLHKKGSQKLLKNKRGIFLSSIMSKVIEKLLKSRMDPELKNVNVLQAGSRANRGCADNLFLLRGIMDHAKYLSRPVYVTFYDYRQCFDSLWLEDCLVSLWEIGVKEDVIAFIHSLNKYANIVIKTPHGISNHIQAESIVKQGTVLGPILCSTSTAEYCTNYHVGGASVGVLHVGSLVFVDDTTDVNYNVDDTRNTHDELLQFAEKKRLSFSHDKCYSLIVNKKKSDEPPNLKIGKEEVKDVDMVKYLGDLFNSKGNSQDLIKNRVSRGMSCIISSFSLCNEISLGMYSLSTQMLMYKSVFLASMLFNCQAWSGLNKGDYNKLQVIQLKYLKKMMQSPTSTPNVCVFLELGISPIKREIDKRKLGFLHHILKCDYKDPVRMMYNEQISLPFEINWANEVQALRSEYGVDHDVCVIQAMSTYEWKKVIAVAVDVVTFNTLKEEAASKSKSKDLKYTKFGLQEYISHLTPEEARGIFKARTRSIDCKANRKSTASDLLCRMCGKEEESQSHIINCRSLFGEEQSVDINIIYDIDHVNDINTLKIICSRLNTFNDAIEEITRNSKENEQKQN